jgi:hypothetical protein
MNDYSDLPRLATGTCLGCVSNPTQEESCFCVRRHRDIYRRGRSFWTRLMTRCPDCGRECPVHGLIPEELDYVLDFETWIEERLREQHRDTKEKEAELVSLRDRIRQLEREKAQLHEQAERAERDRNDTDRDMKRLLDSVEARIREERSKLQGRTIAVVYRD